MNARSRKDAPRVRRTEAEARTGIVEAACAHFIAEGFGGARILDIAKRAGVSHPLLRYYFPTFESLSQAVVESVVESLRERSLEYIQRSEDPRRRLLDYVAAPFDWGIANPGYLSIWLYFYYQASFAPGTRAQNTTIRSGGRARMEELIRHGVSTGAFRLSTKRIPEAALEIQTLITGGVAMAFNENGSSPKRFRELIQRLVLAAVEAKPEPR